MQELTETHGWNPPGAIQPDIWYYPSAGYGSPAQLDDAWWEGGYTSLTAQMVVWEDACAGKI